MRLLAILAPPIVPLIYGKFGQFLLNVILVALGFIPGIIHAWMMVSDTKYEKGQQREKNTMTEHLYKASPSIWRTSPIYFLICVRLIPVVLGVYLLIIEYVLVVLYANLNRIHIFHLIFQQMNIVMV